MPAMTGQGGSVSAAGGGPLSPTLQGMSLCSYKAPYLDYPTSDAIAS